MKIVSRFWEWYLNKVQTEGVVRPTRVSDACDREMSGTVDGVFLPELGYIYPDVQSAIIALRKMISAKRKVDAVQRPHGRT